MLVTLHEVARRAGMKQPSLYGYLSSKLDLYDAMFSQAYEQLLSRLDAAAPRGTARDKLLSLSRIVIDFSVKSLPRQQLLFQRTYSRPCRRLRQTRACQASGGSSLCRRALALGADSPAQSRPHSTHRWSGRPAGRERPRRRPLDQTPRNRPRHVS